MLTFISAAANAWGMRSYLDTWGRPLASRVQLLSYEQLPALTQYRRGTFIFADIEVLSSSQALMAADIWAKLHRHGCRLLNQPLRTMRRYQLLRTLHASGENQFQIYRLTETTCPARFPVLLRLEKEHQAFTDLLWNQGELDRAMLGLLVRGYPLHDALMVEYCDTSDHSGLFRKYSAFIVGDQIVPRHLIFSNHWMQKTPELLDDDKLREEHEYLSTNPHRAWLERVFRLAGVEYGRIDYGVMDGKPQVWEINTNPVVMMEPHKYAPSHLPAQEFFATHIRRSFEAADDCFGAGDGTVSIAPPLMQQRAGWLQGLASRVLDAWRTAGRDRPRVFDAATRVLAVLRLQRAILRLGGRAQSRQEVADREIIEQRGPGRDEDSSPAS